MAKIARDVTLLAQSEVGEVNETSAGRGGSSSMAHKHNLVAAISALGCAQRTPGRVATMLAAMAGEHERAAGAWQAEWETLPELITLTGSAAAWTRDSLTGLKIHPERMAANLAASGVPAGDGRIDARWSPVRCRPRGRAVSVGLHHHVDGPPMPHRFCSATRWAPRLGSGIRPSTC